MAFESREESVEQGAPIELYVFRVYSTNYYFTTAAEDVTVGPVTYQATTLSRSAIEETSEIPRNNITLSVPSDFQMLAFYDGVPPSDVILLSILRMHRGDGDVQPWWNGRVVNGMRQGERGQLHCESVYTSLKRTGLRRLYSRLCPHVLYGAACRAQDSLFRVTVALDGVDGITLSSSLLSTFPDGRFAGGFIEWEPTPGRIEKRGIKAHTGSQILITHPIPDIQGLDEIKVYLGCQHTLTDCDDTFNNAVNYGDFPFVPRQNPMGQSSVF